MRLKLKALMSGPDGNFHPGDEIDVPDAEGRHLIARGYAIEVKARPAETAVPTKTPENTMQRKARK